ncbi:MAG: hypothetical protein ND866_30585 [Pyrinomonadaceae bacterium]|nr:hypothetical protein [Pyrinomonadaceae bacterium]
MTPFRRGHIEDNVIAPCISPHSQHVSARAGDVDALGDVGQPLRQIDDAPTRRRVAARVARRDVERDRVLTRHAVRRLERRPQRTLITGRKNVGVTAADRGQARGIARHVDLVDEPRLRGRRAAGGG